jgi:hypothetical protein
VDDRVVVRMRCNMGGRMKLSVRGMDVEKRIISREMWTGERQYDPAGRSRPHHVRCSPALPLMIEWPFPRRSALFPFASSYSNIAPVRTLFSDVITCLRLIMDKGRYSTCCYCCFTISSSQQTRFI